MNAAFILLGALAVAIVGYRWYAGGRAAHAVLWRPQAALFPN
jgi:hypothetical protein